MNQRNQLIALAVGLLCAGLAFYLLHQKASEMEQRTTPAQVLVAADYIPAGSFLKPEMIQKKTVPEAYISPGTIHDPLEVDGLMSQVPISAGEPILSNDFGPGMATLSADLNRGYRAYTLEVSETSGVGNLLRPGNHVDILTKLETDQKIVTAFVFQNIEVLATGQRLVGLHRTDKKQDDGETQEPDQYDTVTLAVTPEQAQTLMFLEGRPLRLLLRGAGDEEIVMAPSQSESDVISRLGRFAPKTGHGIQIIRGNSKQGD